MEEIDIIELLQRVKEGKAPKEIEINDIKFYYEEPRGDIPIIAEMYRTLNNSYWLHRVYLTLNTKIKILDKPIIGRLEVVDLTNIENTIINIGQKLNEIIDYINQNNKE